VTVFSEAVIFDMEQTVFDSPVSSYQRQGSERREVGEAAHSVLDTFGHPAMFEMFDLLSDLDDTGQSWEVGVFGKLRRHPYLSTLQPSVSLVGHI